jgi:mannose-6-phosphate isomerase-like protein (cupin superfamily)
VKAPWSPALLAIFLSAMALGSGAPQVTHVPAAAVEKSFTQGKTGGLIATGPGFSVSAFRRDGPGEAELHTYDTDIMYVLEGSAIIVTGGRIVGAHEVAPGETRGIAIEGGTPDELAKGDVLTIPSGTPHWFKTVRPPFRYYTVKSKREPAAPLPSR